MMPIADGCVLDLDGTVYFNDELIRGASDAIDRLRRRHVPLCFATNTTRRPRSEIVSRLAVMGIETKADELFTAPVAASRWLAAVGAQRISLLLPELTFEEFRGFTLDDQNPEFVVVGDLGEEWTYDRLNRAFRALLGGAALVAIQKNRFWDPGGGLCLDAGAFVSALEYASGQDAVLVGKPSAPFFVTAAEYLGIPRDRVAIVGDSVANDVEGGQRAGCLGVAVRTGTFREEDLENLERPPDAVLDSIASLPDWLGLQ
jgi:phospholysine phosphohistidine inorganic pyrophosphate phosphatase